MQSLVYYGADDLRLEVRQDQTPGPGQLVVEVAACGICGTDLRIAEGAHRAFPDGTRRIPGHEIAGTIVAGAQGAAFSEGTPVFVAPTWAADAAESVYGVASTCAGTPTALGITLDGGFATHVVIPAEAVQQGNVMPVDAGLDLAAVSVVEPLACVLRGQAPCDIQVGDGYEDPHRCRHGASVQGVRPSARVR